MPNVVWIDPGKLNLEKGTPIQLFDMTSDLKGC